MTWGDRPRPRAPVARKATEQRRLNYDKHRRPTLGARATSWGGEQDRGQVASRVSAPHAGVRTECAAAANVLSRRHV